MSILLTACVAPAPTLERSTETAQREPPALAPAIEPPEEPPSYRIELVGAWPFTPELPELVRLAPPPGTFDDQPDPLVRVPPRILFADNGEIWLAPTGPGSPTVVRDGRLEPYRHRIDVSSVISVARVEDDVVMLGWRGETENVLARLDSSGRARWRRTGPRDIRSFDARALRGVFARVGVDNGLVYLRQHDGEEVACFRLSDGAPRPSTDTFRGGHTVRVREGEDHFADAVRDGNEIALGVRDGTAIRVERWRGGSLVSMQRLSPVGPHAWLIASNDQGYVAREVYSTNRVGTLFYFDPSGRQLRAEPGTPRGVLAVEAHCSTSFTAADSLGDLFIACSEPSGFYVLKIAPAP